MPQRLGDCAMVSCSSYDQRKRRRVLIKAVETLRMFGVTLFGTVVNAVGLEEMGYGYGYGYGTAMGMDMVTNTARTMTTSMVTKRKKKPI